MTTLLTLSETVLTMSSREIAELIGKNHSDLYRSIDRLIAKQVIKGYQPMAYTQPYANFTPQRQEQPFLLPIKQSGLKKSVNINEKASIEKSLINGQLSFKVP